MANCLTCTNAKPFYRFTKCQHENHKDAMLVGEHKCPDYSEIEEPKLNDWEDANGK